jgi:predicted O-methyltransferase YrrM
MIKLVRTEPGGHYVCPEDPTLGTAQYVPRASISEKEGRILQALTVGRSVLEIGTGYGVSARYILAAPARHLTTIDPEPWVRENVHPALEEFDAYCDPAIQEDDDLLYDVIFIDGNHQSHHVIKDFTDTERMLAPGGTFVFHDCHLQGPKHALKSLGITPVLLGTEFGLAIYRPDALPNIGDDDA